MTIPDLPDNDADYLRIAEYLQGECSPADAARIESELGIDSRMQFAAQLLGLALTVPDGAAALEADASWADLTNRLEEPKRTRSRFRRGLRRTEILVGAVGLLIFAWPTYKSVAPIIAGHVYEHYEAPMESRRIVRLPDGSRATLEPGARLTYRASFFPRPRTLTLEGEARFQARPDSDRPFEVHADGVLVRAIGTVFTVRANPWESTVHIAVEEGTVRVWPGAATQSPRTVIPGESVDVPASP
ncbi:MAG TPA: FecR family protein [Gemmatimonadaceae bacterium]|jgi:ferric-dicitrate binding protein FerR (iron transport regulator)|nr:FecR family protein [Gemmatimonadaceae bacterium]